MNHYWQLIQKQHLSDLATQTRLGVVRTVKPVLPEGAQLAAWLIKSTCIGTAIVGFDFAGGDTVVGRFCGCGC